MGVKRDSLSESDQQGMSPSVTQQGDMTHRSGTETGSEAKESGIGSSLVRWNQTPASASACPALGIQGARCSCCLISKLETV